MAIQPGAAPDAIAIMVNYCQHMKRNLRLIRNSLKSVETATEGTSSMSLKIPFSARIYFQVLHICSIFSAGSLQTARRHHSCCPCVDLLQGLSMALGSPVDPATLNVPPPGDALDDDEDLGPSTEPAVSPRKAAKVPVTYSSFALAFESVSCIFRQCF